MSGIGVGRVKNLAVFAARFLKCLIILWTLGLVGLKWYHDIGFWEKNIGARYDKIFISELCRRNYWFFTFNTQGNKILQILTKADLTIIILASKTKNTSSFALNKSTLSLNSINSGGKHPWSTKTRFSKDWILLSTASKSTPWRSFPINKNT